MCDHDVPLSIEQVSHIPHVVPSWRFSGQQVTRRSVMTQGSERITHPPTVLASYEDSHCPARTIFRVTVSAANLYDLPVLVHRPLMGYLRLRELIPVTV